MLEIGSTTLHYETRGDGPPVLLLAPGGLRGSRREAWAQAPWNPMETLAGRYRVVAMDQRNTGTSFAPITADDGWASYTGDQLALMDHLGIDRFSVLGMCIGGPFIMKLIKAVPERIVATVVLQPIGLDGNRDAFRGMFEEWRKEQGDEHPEATDADWEGCWSNLFGSDNLVWSVPDSFLATIDTPMVVLQGDDVFHPKSVSQRVAAMVPSATLVEKWKDPEDRAAGQAAVEAFLAAHTT